MSKGSRRRKKSITDEQMEHNWREIEWRCDDSGEDDDEPCDVELSDRDDVITDLDELLDEDE